MDISRYIDALSCISIFKGIDIHELHSLLNGCRCEIKDYAKNQIIHIQSEVADYMDVILKGEVAVQNIDEDGKVLTVNVFTSMDVIAVNLIFSTRNHYPMTVIAKSSAKILHMHREQILSFLKSNNIFMGNYIRMLSDRTVTLTDKIQAISLKTIRQRLLEFIRYEYHFQKSHTIQLNTSKKNLAQRFGIERSSLSRELNKMRRDGLVEYDARTITIIDKSLL